MNDAAPQQKCPPEGAPAWVMTFADLMSLLMCFFVLLLSFSEMDVLKFKQIAGSMKFAFGVQRTIKAEDIPKGTTVISQEFSPGKPTPTAMPLIQQQTADDTSEQLDSSKTAAEISAEKLAEQVKEALKDEIDEGMLEIDTIQKEVMIRIREKGSFSSGSATLQRSFVPILDKIANVLDKTDGDIIVAGHTDNIPISTPQYPSNWILSAARAANVVHYFSKTNQPLADRMQIRAHADTRPKTENDSSANRAKNRRVEIIIREGSSERINIDDPKQVLEISQ
jgi:chemotaxis protein MotB